MIAIDPKHLANVVGGKKSGTGQGGPPTVQGDSSIEQALAALKRK
jgi:hypothetical protein